MRLFTKTVKVGQEDHKTSFEIPNGSIAWGAIILALVQAVGTIVGNYLSSLPKQLNDTVTNDLRQKNFEVQLLQRVLESSDSNDRANSVALLVDLHLLNDFDSKVIERSETPAKVPRWEKHPIESVNWGTEVATNYNNSLPVNNHLNGVIDTSKTPPMKK